MNRYTQIYINSYVNKDLKQTKTAGVKATKFNFGKAIGNGLKRFGIGTAKSPLVQSFAAKAVVPEVAKAVGVDPGVADQLGTGAMVALGSRAKFPYTKGPMIKNPLLNVAAGIGAGLFANSSDRENHKADQTGGFKLNMSPYRVDEASAVPDYFDNKKLNLSPYDPPAPSELYDPYREAVPNPPFTLSPYSKD